MALPKPTPEKNRPFSNDEVRSTKQDPSPTEPDLEEGEEAAGDIDEDELEDDNEEEGEESA